MHLSTPRLSTFLTFNGNAQEAMEFYESTLPSARIASLTLYDKDAPQGDEGKVLNGDMEFAGVHLLFMDMQAAFPAPEFSWSTSLLIACVDEAEFDGLFDALSAGGVVMMGPEAIMQIRKCAWVVDKFGVTWQLVWN